MLANMSTALQQLHRWIFVLQQVHEARHYVDRAGELGHPEQFQSMDGILEFLVYFRGALNSYAKCFVSSGRGKVKLNKSEVFRTSSDYLDRHSKLMELRHKYVAHSDDNEFEKSCLKNSDTESELVVELQYHFSFPIDRLYELRDLIKHLESYVVDCHANHVAGIERQIGKPVRIKEGEQAVPAYRAKPRSG